MKRRESMDERQEKSGLGRSDRETDDTLRTARPGVTDGARARGLRGQHVVDAYGPDTGNPRRYEPEREAVEGRVQPEYLPGGEAHVHEAADEEGSGGASGRRPRREEGPG